MNDETSMGGKYIFDPSNWLCCEPQRTYQKQFIVTMPVNMTVEIAWCIITLFGIMICCKSHM